MHARKVFGSIAVCVSLLGLQVAIGEVQEVQAASGTVTGTVFNDKDSNGTNGGADVGVSGVVVSAYDSSGAQVGTATTTSNGTYSLNIASSTNSNVRVEFTTPAGYEPSFQGSNNATSIQFVTIPATNVDYAVHIPGDYCQANPSVAAICIRPGTTSLATSKDLSTISQSSWQGSSPVLLTKNEDTGALWGMAFDRQRQVIFASAVLRRHAGLGSRGIAGLYVTDRENGTVVASWDLSASPFNLNFSAGNSAYSDSNRGLVNSSILSRDLPAYADIGKVGIGDIDMSRDGQWLFVTNLYEKKIHRFAVTDTDSNGVPELGAVTSYAIPANTCTNNTARPWGLTYNDTDNSVLIGVVCSNEGQTPFLSAQHQFSNGTGTTSIPDPGVILKLNISSSTFATVAPVDFDYVRSAEIELTSGYPFWTCKRTSSLPTGDSCLRARWHSWTDNFDLINSLPGHDHQPTDVVNLPNDGDITRVKGLVWPQPIIADIEVLPSGEIVLGLMDRFGMQMGMNNHAPKASGDNLFTAYVAGDMVMLCPSGGSFIQNNADGCTPATTDDQYMLNRGAALGGLADYREVFDDNYHASLNSELHQELTIGGLAYNQSTKDLLVTMMDANNTVYTGGVRYLNGDPLSAAFGQYVAGTEFNGSIDALGQGSNQVWNSSFLKSTSMGDVELLCDHAPVQIGNRVWIDTNQNGIQDPGETPVAGVTVRLYDAGGTSLLGTAVTNNNGEYYFSSTVTEAAAGNGDNIGGGLTIGLAYKIRVDKPEDFASGGPLDGYELTQAMATSPATSLDTAVDSNATLVNSYPQLDVVAVMAGANNHTYDVGFKLAPPSSPAPPPSPDQTTDIPINPIIPGQSATIIKVSVGDYVWWDTNRDGIQNSREKGIPNVVLSIRTADGKPVFDVDGKAVQPTTTNKNGRYSFDNLPPGEYEVFVVNPRGFFPTTAIAGSDRGVDSSTRSALSVNLTQNGQRDPTLDFGFYKPPSSQSVSVGNYVWKDRNGDGVQGRADSGVAGAVLTLTRLDGSPVRDIFGRRVRSQVTTDDGKYMFNDLPPGQYMVRIKYPDRHFPTTPDKSGRALNSSSHKAYSKLLQGGQSDLTLDFGMVYRSGKSPLPTTR